MTRQPSASVLADPAVQRGIVAQLRTLDQSVAEGAELIGWKVGVGAPTSMARAGISAPLVGYLTSATVLEDGANVTVDTWQGPMFEAELAIYIGRDVAQDATLGELQAAVAGVGMAIELADVDVPLHHVEQVVAGNVFHRHVILGAPDLGRGLDDVDDLRIEVTNRGEVISVTDDSTRLTGNLYDLLLHVVSWLHAAGRQLSAGEVVITGSMVPLIPLAAGDDLVYRCQPLGSLSAHFGHES